MAGAEVVPAGAEVVELIVRAVDVPQLAQSQHDLLGLHLAGPKEEHERVLVGHVDVDLDHLTLEAVESVTRSR
jgi:hypothetical protein